MKMKIKKPRFFDSITLSSANLRSVSEEYKDYADISLKLAHHINTCFEEMQKLEQESHIEPLSRAKMRHYYRMYNVLGTYDSIWGSTLLELGIPKCKWIQRLFPA